MTVWNGDNNERRQGTRWMDVKFLIMCSQILHNQCLCLPAKLAIHGCREAETNSNHLNAG